MNHWGQTIHRRWARTWSPPRWGFAHHGIYTGDGCVVHYGALLYDLVRRPVEEVPLAAFAQGRSVFLIRHAETCRNPAEVVRFARSRLGENRYSIWTNNCEHFCEWCLHGEPRSFQVEDALDLPRRIGERLQLVIREQWARLWEADASGAAANPHFSRPEPLTSTPTRVPAAASGRGPAGRSDRSPAHTRIDSGSPSSSVPPPSGDSQPPSRACRRASRWD